jgi:Zn-dependent peptidase ImmA (M78 family)
MQEGPVIYNSEFLPKVGIAVIFEDDFQYKDMKPLFDEFGYGFMVPGNNLVVIDGEQLLDSRGNNLLKFIEAHEVSHIVMGHDGPRSDDEELDADLGAYILLEKYGYIDDIKVLLREFKNRHGVRFDTSLLERVKKYFT